MSKCELHRRRSRPQQRLILFLAPALLLLGSSVACKEVAAGQDLAKSGAATANALASYYDSLVDDTVDTMEFEAFISSLRGVPYTDADQNMLERQIAGLQSRAQMARSLGATYGSLATLANYQGATSVTPAAKDLGDALHGIKALPQTSIDPSQYIGQVATKFVEWKQAKDIREANNLLLVCVRSLETLFAKEMETYRSISEERANKVNDILKYLIESDRVTAWPLLDRVPKTLGLAWAANQNAAPDIATKKALVALANARERRLALVSAGVAGELQESLAQVAQAHEQLAAKSSPVLGAIDDLIVKVRAGLDEMAGVRAGKGAEKEK